MKKLADDLIGRRFGRLVIQGKVKKPNERPKWCCKCDCGKEKLIRLDYLTSGKTKSCGCLNREMCQKINLKHGHSRNSYITPTFAAWINLKKRCDCKTDPNYINCGGCGIGYCKRWALFKNFLKDMGEKPSKDLCLSRVDLNNDFCSANCDWVTRSEVSYRRWRHIKMHRANEIDRFKRGEWRKEDD